MEATENDKTCISKVLPILVENLSKDESAKRIKPILEFHWGKGSNGLVSAVLLDLECHLEIFPLQAEHDETGWYRFSDKAVSYEAGIKYLLETLQKILTAHDMSELKDFKSIYELYPRWEVVEDEKFEIEVIAKKSWDYILEKRVGTENYYLSLYFDGIASFDHLYRVQEEDKNLINAENFDALADKYRKKSFDKTIKDVRY
ncbi:hypothetical protein [Lactococcus nasutitermitis]|nr:hypothetical protein [Lactococcus nasutitermitis]